MGVRLCDLERGVSVLSLWSIFLTHTGGDVQKWKQYFPAYERHLSRYVNRPVLLLEIGIAGGGSLQMWKKYLGPLARIVGIDIIEGCKRIEEDQISVRIGSQADEGFLASVVEEFGSPDIVIDDGSHRPEDQIVSFDFLYPRVTRDGVYAVEDLHGPVGFIDHSRTLISQLLGRYPGGQRTVFTDTTLSLHFYDSLVIFERGYLPNRVGPRIGARGGPAIVYEDGILRALEPGEMPRQS